MSRIDLDAVAQSVSHLRGRRKFLFKDPDVERVLDITMALAGELAVTRERLDTVERVLTGQGVVGADAFDSYAPDEAVAGDRLAEHQAMIMRILRVVHQEIEQLEEKRRGEAAGA